jgi:hypothetical protein
MRFIRRENPTMEYPIETGSRTVEAFARGYVACRTKSGLKIHASRSARSSVTDCGYWMKFQASQKRVRGTVKKAALCKGCFESFRDSARPAIYAEMGITVVE